MIQLWFTRRPATLARLIVHLCIISLVEISSYSDSYLLACPDNRTCLITTGKSTHNIHVVISHTTIFIVLLVKAEEGAVLAKEAGHVIVGGGVHRPILNRLQLCGRLRFCGRLLFRGRLLVFRRHCENGRMFDANEEKDSVLMNTNDRVIMAEVDTDQVRER